MLIPHADEIIRDHQYGFQCNVLIRYLALIIYRFPDKEFLDIKFSPLMILDFEIQP
jgi:hypothetical protein